MQNCLYLSCLVISYRGVQEGEIQQWQPGQQQVGPDQAVQGGWYRVRVLQPDQPDQPDQALQGGWYRVRVPQPLLLVDDF